MNIGEDKDKVFYENLESKKQRIQRIENELKSKPTNKDLKFTVSVLKDFDIHIDTSQVPDFSSVYLLEQWKSKIIKNKLDAMR